MNDMVQCPKCNTDIRSVKYKFTCEQLVDVGDSGLIEWYHPETLTHKVCSMKCANCNAELIKLGIIHKW
jgi:hypothetical protein